MKCPVCEKNKLKSIVYPGMQTITAAGFASYYDEGGYHHSHNPNTLTTGYTCSKGHQWIIKSSIRRCPHCDFGRNSSDTINIIKDTTEESPLAGIGIIGDPLIGKPEQNSSYTNAATSTMGSAVSTKNN